jgi:hypothetical protein
MQCTCTILSTLTCPPLQYFSALSHKWQNFRKQMVLNIKCVYLFSLQLLSATYLILKRTERDMINNYVGRHAQYCYSCHISMKLGFPWQNFEQHSNIKFHENLSGGSWGHVDELADMRKLIVAFCNFANVPTKLQRDLLFWRIRVRVHHFEGSICFLWNVSSILLPENDAEYSRDKKFVEIWYRHYNLTSVLTVSWVL